jgi:hypothetical protein
MNPFLTKDGADVENNGGGWADSGRGKFASDLYTI